MFEILSQILGTKNALKEKVDLIDSLVKGTTSKDKEVASDQRVNLLKAYEPFKVTQRVVALMIIPVYLVSFFILFVMAISGIGDVDAGLNVITAFSISWIVLTIIGFYFGGGAAEGVIDKFKKKH